VVVAFLLIGEVQRLVDYSDVTRPRALFDIEMAWEGVTLSDRRRCIEAAGELRAGALSEELKKLGEVVKSAPRNVVLERLEPSCHAL
jgi:hypothetical protein